VRFVSPFLVIGLENLSLGRSVQFVSLLLLALNPSLGRSVWFVSPFLLLFLVNTFQSPLLKANPSWKPYLFISLEKSKPLLNPLNTCLSNEKSSTKESLVRRLIKPFTLFSLYTINRCVPSNKSHAETLITPNQTPSTNKQFVENTSACLSLSCSLCISLAQRYIIPLLIRAVLHFIWSPPRGSGSDYLLRSLIVDLKRV